MLLDIQDKHEVEPMTNIGSVKSVRGSVVDVCFQGSLPQINQMLLVGIEKQITLEVASYLKEPLI